MSEALHRVAEAAPPPELELLELRHSPARAALTACSARARRGDSSVWIVDLPTEPEPAGFAALLRRRGDLLRHDLWPAPGSLAPGDRLTLRVAPEQAEAFVDYLRSVAALGHPPALIAPWCPEPLGTHRLWLVAVARIALPLGCRVETRHDLVGTRIAQLALAFGADALGGPVAPDRSLPLAGVARPTETTRAGLTAMVEQAGLTPHFGAESELP